MNLKFDVKSPAETASLAAATARILEAGDVVFLAGPLGAGKTLFVREAASKLGVEEVLTSPSFSLARSYQGRTPVHHLDLYRLEGFSRYDQADFEPFFEGDAITFVEWPEPLIDLIIPSVNVTIEHRGGDRRLITIVCAEELMRKLEAALGDFGA